MFFTIAQDKASITLIISNGIYIGTWKEIFDIIDLGLYLDLDVCSSEDSTYAINSMFDPKPVRNEEVF